MKEIIKKIYKRKKHIYTYPNPFVYLCIFLIDLLLLIKYNIKYKLNRELYNTKKLLENKSFFIKDNIFAYIMDRESSVDIDEEIDFKITEVIASKATK